MRITFSCGLKWDVKTVPVYLLADVDAAVLREMGGFPTAPQLPMLTHETKTGEKQELPAHEGTPEYSAYLAAYREYREARRDKEAEFSQAKNQRRERVALLWAFNGLTVPDEWEPPTLALTEAGVTPAGPDESTEMLLQYIRYGVVQTQADDVAVFTAMWGEQAVEDGAVEETRKAFF